MILPRISIIITTFNRTAWLTRAVESCSKQDYPNLEIIIVDDGSSTQDAEHVVSKYEMVQYVWHENRGLGYSRNEGVRLSSGEFIQFLDDDDWLTTNSVSKKMSLQHMNKRNTIIYSDLFLTNAEERILGRYFTRKQRELPTNDLFPHLVKNNFIPVHAVLWPRRILEDIGGFPDRSGAEDWEVLVKASLVADFAYLDQPLGYYRLHAYNMSFDQHNQMAGDTEVQELIVRSKRFDELAPSIQVDCLANYSLRQWMFGSEIKAHEYYQKACRIQSTYPKIVLMSILLWAGRSFTKFFYQIYWRLKLFITPLSASNYFLSHLKHRSSRK